MPSHDPHHHEAQDRSIKARKHQLFEDDEVEFGPRRSFAEALRETPAAPLDPVARGALWAVGVLVILLLLAAFAKVGTRKPRTRTAPAASARPRLDAEILLALDVRSPDGCSIMRNEK